MTTDHWHWLDIYAMIRKGNDPREARRRWPGVMEWRAGPPPQQRRAGGRAWARASATESRFESGRPRSAKAPEAVRDSIHIFLYFYIFLHRSSSPSAISSLTRQGGREPRLLFSPRESRKDQDPHQGRGPSPSDPRQERKKFTIFT